MIKSEQTKDMSREEIEALEEQVKQMNQKELKELQKDPEKGFFGPEGINETEEKANENK